MTANILAIFYLISGVLFILALRGLSSPETSRRGNFFGIIGMAIAISVTIQSAEKTLNDNDLENINNSIIRTVENKTGAKIRS